MGPTGIQSTLPLGPPGQPRGLDHTARWGTLQGPGPWESVRGAGSGGGDAAMRAGGLTAGELLTCRFTAGQRGRVGDARRGGAEQGALPTRA